MRKQNIVLFSSGISEQSGRLNTIKNGLEKMGYDCFCWRDLFSNANNSESIALLPMLIKKIPTFDFSILICEGHDTTSFFRDGTLTKVATMRDNVLFEIGMCTMALGVSRVILVSDKNVHLPEDLAGMNGRLALKHIVLENDDSAGLSAIVNLDTVLSEINEYIVRNHNLISPVVIGASSATAEGYVTNFVLRVIEHIEDGFVEKGSVQNTSKKTTYPLSNIYFNIVIPYMYDESTPKRAKEMLSSLKTGIVETARSRSAEFNYYEAAGKLYIVDYPTTLVTSYDTAKMILNLSADDTADTKAESRFITKELDLFELTLMKAMHPDSVRQHIDHFYQHITLYEREKLTEKMYEFFETHLTVTRENY